MASRLTHSRISNIDNQFWWMTESLTSKDWTHKYVWTPQHAEWSKLANVFIDTINLMGSNHNLLSCWWHFDHCINMAIILKVEAETQWITAKNLFRRLQLLNIDKKIWLIIVAEHGWILHEKPWSLNSRTIRDVWIRDVWTSSSLGIFIPSTIMINITHHSNHYVQFQRIIHNGPKYSRTSSTTKWWPSATSNSSSGNTNLALAVFGCLWESLIVFAKDWLHVWA